MGSEVMLGVCLLVSNSLGLGSLSLSLSLSAGYSIMKEREDRNLTAIIENCVFSNNSAMTDTAIDQVNFNFLFVNDVISS